MYVFRRNLVFSAQGIKISNILFNQASPSNIPAHFLALSLLCLKSVSINKSFYVNPLNTEGVNI